MTEKELDELYYKKYCDLMYDGESSYFSPHVYEEGMEGIYHEVYIIQNYDVPRAMLCFCYSEEYLNSYPKGVIQDRKLFLEKYNINLENIIKIINYVPPSVYKKMYKGGK